MYQHLLVCLDDSEMAPLILDHALDVANRHDATIHIASIVDSRSWASVDNYLLSNSELIERAREDALQLIQSYIEEKNVQGVTFDVVIEVGSPRTVITKKIAPNVNADVIILGATSVRGLDHLVVGSVTSAVLNHAPCDVLVVRRP
ncbi:universal stress protein [Kurthia senegalensis]|uniref:universal stress protein n=1 Tax=Kurthia senegalensis TaxID=1033740 RepID=UPI000288A0C3|nr:universal stress protein [Kurthia senegalensis]